MNGTRVRRIAAVERYIHELAIALADVPADEREEVIAGVREHIEDALAALTDPGDPDVQRVLASLGDPAEIAADARGRAGSPGASAEPGRAAARSTTAVGAAPSERTLAPREAVRPVLARGWIPAGVMGLFFLAAFAVWFTGPGSPLGVLLWLGGLVALIASPLWSVAEKVVGALWFGGVPVVAVAAGLVLGRIHVIGRPDFVVDRLGPPAGPFRSVWADEWGWVAAAGFGIVGLIVTVAIMAWLVTTGVRRAQRLAS